MNHKTNGVTETVLSVAQIDIAYKAIQHHLANVVAYGVSNEVFWDPIAKDRNNELFHKVLGLHEMLAGKIPGPRLMKIAADLSDRFIWIRETMFTNTELRIMQDAFNSYINRCVQDPEFNEDPTGHQELLDLITK